MNEDNQKTQYNVKTSVFEGPLQVLLEMIENRKLFINEISLASVAEDYINYVKNLGSDTQEHISDVTGFVVVAATLILIKSRSLLPNLELAPEEETAIDDLEKRLRLYQKVQEIGGLLKTQFGKKILFVREESLDIGPVFTPDEQITLPGLAQALRDVISALPKKEILPEIAVRKVMSIEEMMNSLEERIQKSLSMSFSDFSRGAHDATPKEQKVHVIISFLALLELVRSGITEVIQNNQFDDMMITKQETQNIINGEDSGSEIA